jgi:hypothetical protein
MPREYNTLIQGDTPDELPEAVFGGARIISLDFANCAKFQG